MILVTNLVDFVNYYGKIYGDHEDQHVLTHSFPTRRVSDLSGKSCTFCTRYCAFTKISPAASIAAASCAPAGIAAITATMLAATKSPLFIVLPPDLGEQAAEIATEHGPDVIVRIVAANEIGRAHV